MAEREVRTLAVRPEVRADGDGGRPRIVGTAIVFGEPSEDLGGFREIIEPGALTEALERSDVRVLFNHNPDLILGRVRAGTARLRLTDRGLEYEVDVPDTTVGRDVLESVRRGDVTGNSFSFTVAEDEMERQADGTTLRRVKRIAEIYDIGPVVYPAYPQTVVSARALEAARREAEERPVEQAPAAPDLRALRHELVRATID